MSRPFSSVFCLYSLSAFAFAGRQPLQIFTNEFIDGRGKVEYRTIDGSGNNKQNSAWGVAGSESLRIETPAYEGYAGVSGIARPPPRVLSNLICNSDDEGDVYMNKNRLSGMTWLWGQFLDHDMTFVGYFYFIY